MNFKTQRSFRQLKAYLPSHSSKYEALKNRLQFTSITNDLGAMKKSTWNRQSKKNSIENKNKNTKQIRLFVARCSMLDVINTSKCDFVTWLPFFEPFRSLCNCFNLIASNILPLSICHFCELLSIEMTSQNKS